jgi:HTH-type transcriptional regulator / antitoxin HigA
MTRKGIQVHPIRTEQDHDRALARIDELMGAKFGSPEGDELDILAALLDAHEAEHFPMDAPIR